MLRKLFISFETMIFHSKIWFSSKKLNICFENITFSFIHMNVSKKVNYLLRKYNLPSQEYAKVTPKWDELTFFPRPADRR